MMANNDWRQVMNNTHFHYQPNLLDKNQIQAQKRNPLHMAIGRHNHLQTSASRPGSGR
jgi:hypothetical protein